LAALDAYVQVITSWIAVEPTVPPLKPAYAVVDPIVLERLIGHEYVNDEAVTVSVIVRSKLVPSYVTCACMMSPECRLRSEVVMSTAGVVGDAPFTYSPVESDPSPVLL
jgi:hypothetical protein